MRQPKLLLYTQSPAHQIKEALKARLDSFHLCNEHDCKTHGHRGPQAVGKRLASAKATAADANYRPGEGPRMSLDLITDDMLLDKKSGPGLISRQAAVPGFEDFAGRTDRAVLDEIADRQAENIVEVADLIMENAPGEAAATADWYPWANEYMRNVAADNGLTDTGVIAAAAALSASAPWESNVPWANFMAENLATNKGPEGGVNQKVDSKWAVAAYMSELAAGHSPNPETYSGLIGKKLGDLSDSDIALVLRGKHDASGTFNPKTGKFSKGEVRQLGEEVHAGLGKKGAGTIPQSQANLEKAVSVLRNPSEENIDRHIGSQNKVRSFYQNMRDPLDQEFSDVTVDTHHFGIANGAPWTVNTRFVASGTNNVTSSPGNAATGALGTYALVVEATRRATNTLNARHGTSYTPNQIQSIVWEAWKDRYPPKKRSDVDMQSAVESARTRQAQARSARARGEISEAQFNARFEAATADIDTARTSPGKNSRGQTVAAAPTVAELIEQYTKGR